MDAIKKGVQFKQNLVGFMCLSLICRHENIQFLEKLKQLVLFIERKLEKKVRFF